MQKFKRLSEFLKEYYPNLNSLQDIDLRKAKVKWIDWLNSQNIKTMRKHNYLSKLYENEYSVATDIANFLENIVSWFNILTDERKEWEKDKWDIRNIAQYGISYNKSISHYYIDFSKVNNIAIRENFKKYIKQRLISSENFSWGTAVSYLNTISIFVNTVCELEPIWNDLKGLERQHILKYIERLNIYAKENSTNPKQYVAKSLSIVQKFLLDIQVREYDIASIKNVKTLILPEDKPKLSKKSNDQIDYISDFVLEQLFDNINNLHTDVIPVVYTMFKTGLRISDVLGLKQDCLVKLNNKFWIETDIEKTYVKGHRIPIDDELANMLAVLIDSSKKYSNDDNNPKSIYL